MLYRVTFNTRLVRYLKDILYLLSLYLTDLKMIFIGMEQLQISSVP